MIDFFSNGLVTYCHSVNRELSRIEKYNSLIEDLWVNSTVDIDDKYANDLAYLEGDEKNDLGQTYYSELIEETIIPSIIHNQSIVVTLSSFVEYSLYELCIKLDPVSKTDFKLARNKSKVQQCMEYLDKVLGVSDCSKLVDCYRVRNEIVHNSGVCSEKYHVKLTKFPREQIKALEGDRIDIKSLFITCYLKVIKEYFESLDLGIKSFIRAYNQTNA
ncbi:hypothetical protein [Psychromonas sp. SP041]|uniref:hypothetical protein n=1 Tax=Psychromonas sp. SP041 TaxID=1365007 RepID=UPI000408F90D|nr:hypothetical protein [Psychromonas sp. SP041]